MAAARKKVKKPTDEYPELRMLIEGGRLVPAYPLDAERLASYANGTKAVVWLTVDAGHERPLIRQWWAVLGWYSKNTDLPWGKSKEAGSTAIKHTLRMFTPTPTDQARSRWVPNYHSLTEYDDDDLREFLEQMKALLFHLTGVDQETYRKESGHGFNDIPFIPESPGDNPASPDDGAGSATDSSPVGGTEPATPLIEHDSPEDDAPPRPGEEPASAAQPLAGAGGDQSSDDDESQSGDASDDGDSSSSAEAIGDGAQSAAAPPDLPEAEVEWLRKAAARIVLRDDFQPGDKMIQEMRGIFREMLQVMPSATSRDAKSRMVDIQTLTMSAAKGEDGFHTDVIASLAFTTVSKLAIEAKKARTK